MQQLKIGGITPFTSIDYPGRLAAVIFVQGCPWRCRYCHNPHLQPRVSQAGPEWKETMRWLQRRVGLIDAVVFSGGEATIDPALPAAMRDVRSLGFQVGLHTAGIYPHKLADLLPQVDWVGLDIKAPFAHYEQVTQVADSGRLALRSVEAVLASGIPCEMRTTIHPALLAEDDILSLACTLAKKGVTEYALQLFRPQGCGDARLDPVPAGYPSPALLQRLHGMFPRFVLRQA